MTNRFRWGLLVPPFVALMISIGVVRTQAARHAKIDAELRGAKQEVSRLERLLPKGETVPSTHADDCDEDHHGH